VTRLPDSQPLDAATPYNVRATMPVKRTLAVLEAAANAYLPLFHDMQAAQWDRFVRIGRQPAAEAKHVADNIDAINRPPFNARVFTSVHAKMASNQKLEMRVSPSTVVALRLAHRATFLTDDMEDADTHLGLCPELVEFAHVGACLRHERDWSSDYAKIWVDDTSRLIVVGLKALVSGEHEEHSTLDALAGTAGILYSRMKGTQRYREAVAAVARALREKPSYAMVAVGWCMGGHLAMEISDVFGIPAIVFNPAPRVKIFWQACVPAHAHAELRVCMGARAAASPHAAACPRMHAPAPISARAGRSAGSQKGSYPLQTRPRWASCGPSSILSHIRCAASAT
jgi:hypothetical protein